MNNFQTPYACSICRKEFSTAISLVKHVELRHSKSKGSSILSKKDIEITKSYSSDDHRGHSSNSKQCMKSKQNEPFILKIEENETDDQKSSFYSHG